MGHRVQTVSTAVTKKGMKKDTKWAKPKLEVSEGLGRRAFGGGLRAVVKDIRKCRR